MADLVTVDNGTLTDYTVLTDEVTDGVLGTGQKQLFGLIDATVGGTNKAAVLVKSALKVSEGASTGTVTSVSGSASNQTLLSANTSRVGATIWNDSTAILYVKLAATATSSSFTYRLASQEVCELPYGYTGIVDGIWASATGAARVTEYT